MIWTAATSVDPHGWSEDNPAHGQCAPTVLLIQDLFGGDLLRVENEGISHYYNRLPDGTEVDLTRGQFARWEPTEAEVRTREYVLSYPLTLARYVKFRETASEALS